MLPLILISKTEKTVDKFLIEFIKQNNYAQHLVYKIFPVNKELTIDQIRQIRKQVGFAMSSNRLFVLYAFEKSSAEVQNALLKTLEEKTANNQFILVSENEELVLTTIHSRSKVLYLDKPNKAQKIKKEVGELIEKARQEKCHAFLSDILIAEINHDKAITLIDQIIIYLKTKLLEKDNEKVAITIKQALEIKKLIQNNNLNPQLAIDNLFITVSVLLRGGGTTTKQSR